MIDPLTLRLLSCDFCDQSFSLIVSAYTVTGCSECEAEDRVMEEERCWWESRGVANCDMLDSMDRWSLLSIYGWLASSHGARHCFGTTGAVATAVASQPLSYKTTWCTLHPYRRSASEVDTDEIPIFHRQGNSYVDSKTSIFLTSTIDCEYPFGKII